MAIKINVQVRPVAEEEMFKVMRTGKRKSKYCCINFVLLMNFANVCKILIICRVTFMKFVCNFFEHLYAFRMNFFCDKVYSAWKQDAEFPLVKLTTTHGRPSSHPENNGSHYHF